MYFCERLWESDESDRVEERPSLSQVESWTRRGSFHASQQWLERTWANKFSFLSGELVKGAKARISLFSVYQTSIWCSHRSRLEGRGTQRWKGSTSLPWLQAPFLFGLMGLQSSCDITHHLLGGPSCCSCTSRSPTCKKERYPGGWPPLVAWARLGCPGVCVWSLALSNLCKPNVCWC